MIPPEVCVQLAKAYPQEIGAHKCVEGDWFYHRDDYHPGEWYPEPCLCYDAGGGSPCHDGPDEGDLWIPRAADMLPIISRVGKNASIILTELPRGWMVAVNNIAWTAPTVDEALGLWLLGEVF